MGLHGFARLAGAAAALLIAGGAASAGDVARPSGVVELFTSQGCSSCPPADELLGELVRQGEVIALAYHVDYWDYLGWSDTLGSKENTQRQHDYRKSLKLNSVYTPQAVVNGRTHVNGADREAVGQALAESGLPVPVRITRSGDRIVIEAGESTRPGAEAHVMLVYFEKPTKVTIANGENGGRTIAYWNAVSGIQAAGIWQGEAARFEMPASEIAKKGEGGCAVLLQETDGEGVPGAILGAALIENRDRR